MANSKKGLLSSQHGVHLSKKKSPQNPQEEEEMKQIPYAFVVGSLMYAMLCTRPDICHAVGVVSGSLEPIGNTDSNFQTDVDDTKLTFGTVFTLGGEVVIWRSVKQPIISYSTIEDVYIAVSEAAKKKV
ncbi:secreted RxLR effector protein 161-like [Humulus lupulus]|uniref:secreted RxLR effector protein 161-like n=1 Tax=Humulus lupulus TaxID=3486 RepID=UPI002B411294|nr:secreted RxLR effector protein 161-like [Humulus lupulus]